MDEYLDRYRSKSHRELYQAIEAGDPVQVDGLVSHWKSIEEVTRLLADDLRQSLAGLAQDWTGAAGREYQNRLALVVSYATGLADDYQAVGIGLELMGRQVADAKSAAEDPAVTEDHGGVVKGVVSGVAAGTTMGVPGVAAMGFIGGVFGHRTDEQQKDQAHARMATLVAALAAEYGTLTQGYLRPPVVPPAGLPGDPRSGTAAGAGSGAVTQPVHRTPTTGTSHAGPRAVADAHRVGGADLRGGTDPGGSAEAPDPHSGTSLAGADSGVVGAGGLVGVAAFAGQVVALPGSLGATSGGTQAAPVVSGLAGSATGAGPSNLGASQGGSGWTSSGTRRMGMETGVIGGSASARSAPDDDEQHDSWLTEDEIVWGTDRLAPPAVLGASAAGQSHPDQARTD